MVITEQIEENTITSFVKLKPSELKTFASVPQCLDDQWAPLHYIEKMYRDGKSRKDQEQELKPLVRRGLMRSLLQSEQIIINRAFFRNCPTLVDLYHESEERDDLEDLISSSVITTYLMNENGPVGNETYDIDENRDRQHSWSSLCGSTDMHCVKLSWDEQQNKAKITNLLGRRFQEVTTGFEYGDSQQYCRDFGLDPNGETASAFKKRLRELSDFATREHRRKSDIAEDANGTRDVTTFVTRSDLYSEFVSPQGTKPNQGYVDKTKPFSREIKQLIDLRYNINLPDALDRFSAGASGTIERRVLQESHFAQGNAKSISAEELGRAIANIGFNLAPQSFEPIALSELSLAQIKSLRSSPLFDNYIKTAKRIIPKSNGEITSSCLFNNPNESLKDLSEAYIELIKEAGRRAATKPVSAGDWQPQTQLLINFVGTPLTMVIWPDGTFLDIPSLIDPIVDQPAVAFTIEYIISRRRRKNASQKMDKEFELRIPILKAKTEDATETLKIIRDQILSHRSVNERPLDPQEISKRRSSGLEPRDLEDDTKDD